MQIKKVYSDVSPGLLYDEIKEFVQKQGVSIGDARLETYSLPSDSSSFVYRGTITFRSGKDGEDCLRAHLVGSPHNETKLILDINEKLFPQEKVTALQEDLDFIFSSYEAED